MELCSSCGTGGENQPLEPLGSTDLSFCANCAQTMRDFAKDSARKGRSPEAIIADISARYSLRQLDDTGIVQSKEGVAQR